MHRNNIKRMAIAAAIAALALPAQAGLIDRGGGMLYDDVLNITWLQDANYAKTSGYDTDGRMNWAAANAWAANLVYGGFDDWRLASNSPVGANWNYGFNYNGTTDVGYNITRPNSELSYMYYVNLGLKGYYSTSGAYQSDFGIFGNGTGVFQNNVGLVNNLHSEVYWSGTAYAPLPPGTAWSFGTYDGYQNVDDFRDYVFYAWAVRSGDVAAVGAVPEPETYAMLLAGLGLLGGMARRRKARER